MMPSPLRLNMKCNAVSSNTQTLTTATSEASPTAAVLLHSQKRGQQVQVLHSAALYGVTNERAARLL